MARCSRAPRELLDGLAGRIVEVGARHGTNFPHYPPSVERVVAIEPEGYLRRRAEQAAASAPIPVSVLDATAESLPGEDGSFDAGVVSLVLCTVPDQGRALGELFSKRASFAHIQRLEEATFWPWLLGGCHPARDTSSAITRAGFVIERCERFAFSPVPLFSMPHILGVARRPN